MTAWYKELKIRYGIISIVLATNLLQAQTIAIGDTLHDLSGPICSGTDNTFNLDDFNIAGSYPSVILITFFTSW